MTNFIALTALWALSIMIGVLVMIHGYGIEPVSYKWIIGLGAIGRLLVEVISSMAKSEAQKQLEEIRRK